MWRLRGDALASLADITQRLSDPLTPEDQRPKLRTEITELVRLLDPLETYWAYPGPHSPESDASLCDAGDYESAMRMADTVTRVISGNAEGAAQRDQDDAASAVGQPAGDPLGRPAFRVLAVDDLPDAEVTQQRQKNMARLSISRPRSWPLRRAGPRNGLPAGGRRVPADSVCIRNRA